MCLHLRNFRGMGVSCKTGLIWKRLFGPEIVNQKRHKSLEVNWRHSPHLSLEAVSPWRLPEGNRCHGQRCLSNTSNFSLKSSCFSSPIKPSVSRGFAGGLNPASLPYLCKPSSDVNRNSTLSKWKHVVTSFLICANIRTVLCAYLISHQQQGSLLPKRSFLLPKY